jgi:peptidoglycan hydrolase-like protein with peptidoglycan-binding domain
MALKAKFWDSFDKKDRVDQAASVPFHSIHLASHDNGTSAVTAIQEGLKRIEQNTGRFIFFFRPEPIELPGSRWGPFNINQEVDIDGASFGTSTDLAVQKFQEQADLEPDGKVGMKTLTQLDNMLAFLEIPNPQPSPFDSD